MNTQIPRISPPSLPQLAAIREGCPHAADELVRSYEPRIRALAIGHVRPACGKDELEQEGRIAIWRAALRYDPELGKFEHFATKAIKNAFLTVGRGNPVIQQELESVQSTQRVGSMLAGLDLDAARTRLAPAEADVIRLLYEEGLTQRQAATRLDLSQARVSQLHRAAIDQMRSEAGIAA